jgi:hypothetical protein
MVGRDGKQMRPEIFAEVTLFVGADKPPSPVGSYGFIVSFGSDAFSAAVIPAGAGALRVSEPRRVQLRFLVEAALPHLKPGNAFTFSDQGRLGTGKIE